VIRRAIADVLFVIAALIGVIGVHKYVFGDFPKLWLVRGLPWHLVNPYAAFVLCLAIASVAARITRTTQRRGTAVEEDEHERVARER
jgi:divalent metal cation (Fe/Co/Zn/Cd) transporter